MLRKKLIRRADSGDDQPTTRLAAQPDETGEAEGDPSENEERDAPRCEARLVASLEIEENAYLGFTENLSELGAFIATKAPPNLGAQVSLLIALPDLALVRAQGTVRWLRSPSQTEGRSAGIGIRFERLSALDAVRIQDFVKARQSRRFDAEGV